MNKNKELLKDLENGSIDIKTYIATQEGDEIIFKYQPSGAGYTLHFRKSDDGIEEYLTELNYEEIGWLVENLKVLLKHTSNER